MGKEAAEAFVKRYGSDEEFRNKVNGLESPQAIRTFLDEQGFGTFTKQELEEARRGATAAGQLSDADLEAVAGGLWGIDVIWEGTCSNWGDYKGCLAGYSCGSVW